MSRKSKIRFDEIGYWSEIKLDIIRDYAAAYSKILSAQTKSGLHHAYIDAFSGAGVHISKESKKFIQGSPLNALLVDPPFKEYFFIDFDCKKVALLKEIIGDRPDVLLYEGDCNSILLKEVFPKIRYNEFKRALCLLDPYGLHLNWDVIQTAGEMRSIEIFLNFPVMDMNMNVLWNNPSVVPAEGIERMNAFWGDNSWSKIAYKEIMTLFGPEDEKVGIEKVADGFKERLQNVAGFEFVPKPLPMRNTKGGIVYYLFFASHNKTGGKIVNAIFNKYRHRGL